MLFKTKLKIKTKLILQHSILSPPSSHNAIVDTGATKYFVMPNTTLINKKKTILLLHVQLINGTLLKSTHGGNLQIAAQPKKSTKSHVFTHVISDTLILVAQLCDHGFIATFSNIDVIIYNKHIEPQIKIP